MSPRSTQPLLEVGGVFPGTGGRSSQAGLARGLSEACELGAQRRHQPRGSPSGMEWGAGQEAKRVPSEQSGARPGAAAECVAWDGASDGFGEAGEAAGETVLGAGPLPGPPDELRQEAAPGGVFPLALLTHLAVFCHPGPRQPQDPPTPTPGGKRGGQVGGWSERGARVTISTKASVCRVEQPKRAEQVGVWPLGP